MWSPELTKTRGCAKLRAGAGAGEGQAAHLKQRAGCDNAVLQGLDATRENHRHTIHRNLNTEYVVSGQNPASKDQSLMRLCSQYQ